MTRHVIVPATALQDSRLSMGDFKCLCHLSTYADTSDGRFWRYQATIAKDMGISERQLRTYLSNLNKAGYLQITPRYEKNRQTYNIYRLILDQPAQAEAEPPRAEAELPPRPEAELPPGVEAELPTEERTHGTNNINISARTREDFYNSVEDWIEAGEFNDMQAAPELIRQLASEAWDHWQAHPDRAPKDQLAGLRQYYRKAREWNRIGEAEAPQEARQESAEQLTGWRKEMSERIGYAAYSSWIKPCRYSESEDTLYARSKFMADWIAKHYMSDLEAILGEDVMVSIETEKEEA